MSYSLETTYEGLKRLNLKQGMSLRYNSGGVTHSQHDGTVRKFLQNPYGNPIQKQDMASRMKPSDQPPRTHFKELSKIFAYRDSTPRLDSKRGYVAHEKALIMTPTSLSGGCHVSPISLQDYPMQCHRSFFTSATCNKTFSLQFNKKKAALKKGKRRKFSEFQKPWKCFPNIKYG